MGEDGAGNDRAAGQDTLGELGVTAGIDLPENPLFIN